MSELIDRRANGRHKSAVNRQRFLRRYQSQLRDAVKGMAGERSITDMDRGGKVKVPVKDISEPTFHHDRGGDREMVHPGNKEFVTGDRIPRPDGGGGQGGRGDPGEGGDSVDEFVFTLSREEFLNIFFEDLELPRLVRNQLGDTQQKKLQRAGYVRDGSPSNLSVVRSLKMATARRVALTGPSREELDEAKARLEMLRSSGAGPDETAALEQQIAELEGQIARVPFLDDVDLRYRHRVAVPKPVARAVMFCLMDVSASMDERKKDLAKRFFTLLYLFLSQKYEKVDLVFIRHTDDAEEVDEQTFFHDPKSGGTVVLSALELMAEVVEARYPPSSWNIYAAQASDGDAFGSDAGKSARFVAEELLPLTRYFAYIEVPDSSDARTSSLWIEYQTIEAAGGTFAMKRVAERSDIYPVFRELFQREAA